MAQQNNENIEKLFQMFADEKTAQDARRDFEYFDDLLNSYPDPTPDPETIGNIKNAVRSELHKQSTNKTHHALIKVAAVAAVFFIIASVATKYFQTSPPQNNQANTQNIAANTEQQVIPQKIWQADDIATEDTQLASYNSEIQYIEQQLYTLQNNLDEYSDSSADISEIEIELIKFDNQFWEG